MKKTSKLSRVLVKKNQKILVISIKKPADQYLGEKIKGWIKAKNQTGKRQVM